jgi:hypothetical protein
MKFTQNNKKTNRWGNLKSLQAFCINPKSKSHKTHIEKLIKKNATFTYIVTIVKNLNALLVYLQAQVPTWAQNNV